MHVLLKTIIVLLFVLLRAGAEYPRIVLPVELSDAMRPGILDIPIEEYPGIVLPVELSDEMPPGRLDIPIEERPALYLELSQDENYSRELQEYAGKRYRLVEIRQKMLNLLQGVHDQKSAEAAIERILSYDKEVAEMHIRQAFIKAKRKADCIELYLLAHLYEWEGRGNADFRKEMVSCIEEKNLYQYETLKHELKPRLHSRWNLTFDMPSFCVSTEAIIAAYKEIHEDTTRSTELREFADRCIKLNGIREKMLEAVSMIHDETSAVEAGEVLARYNDEIGDLDMLRYYIEIKDKLSKEEQKILDQMLLWRYDEATAFMSKYLRIWEERGLEQYESKVKIIRESVELSRKYHPLWTDYMARRWYSGGKPRIQIEESVRDLIFELDCYPYDKVLYRGTGL